MNSKKKIREFVLLEKSTPRKKMTKKSGRMRNRTMLGQTLISVSTCPTTITSAILLTIVNGIRQKGIPYLFL